MTDPERYMRAIHAMQSGVAMELEHSPTGHAKHLRVGVNAAMRDCSSITQLLVDKGLLTEKEVFKALADGMEEEVRQYEERLTIHFGAKITLH